MKINFGEIYSKSDISEISDRPIVNATDRYDSTPIRYLLASIGAYDYYFLPVPGGFRLDHKWMKANQLKLELLKINEHAS